MDKRNFRRLLELQWALKHFVCVGLDSNWAMIPSFLKEGANIAYSIVRFNQSIIEATRELACAYKLNVAFYEACGVEGLTALRSTISFIQTVAIDVPVILDAKRADIGSTNAGYVTSAFDYLKADAITVHPYLGAEALGPFLDQADKGIVVLCRTSNPGAGEFQDLLVNGEPLYRIVAKRVASDWNRNNNCAVVVGATYPNELHEVREIIGDMPILIPGIGAQGGDLEKTVLAGKDSRGGGMIINASRSIIFASQEADFADAARQETERLHGLINQILSN